MPRPTDAEFRRLRNIEIVIGVLRTLGAIFPIWIVRDILIAFSPSFRTSLGCEHAARVMFSNYSLPFFSRCSSASFQSSVGGRCLSHPQPTSSAKARSLSA
ncbi:hypothetical protein SAMN03159496_06087 [Rhizobium sp. NFR07]|jgi:hypothetical protein|nr:hypothetical protein SAMN03159496_06087 [Rhizobium sp. NFR07]